LNRLVVAVFRDHPAAAVFVVALVVRLLAAACCPQPG
jgi:hypothetical protein